MYLIIFNDKGSRKNYDEDRAIDDFSSKRWNIVSRVGSNSK